MLTINYGKDWVKATYDALKASDISSYLKLGMSVAMKPNLVNTTHPSEGATTHPEVVEGIILFLKDFGIKDMRIMESSALGHNTKRAYKVCGYESLEKKYGVPLVDLKNVPTTTLSHNGLEIKIAKEAFDTDFFINVPVLKAHCQTRLTCCMKNLKGCIPESEMRRFHTLGLHKPIAALSALLPVHYCVVDGICGDLSFEEGGTPVEANRIIVGRNPVEIDCYCAGLIGYKPEDIGYLSHVGIKMPSNVTELNTDQKPTREQKSARISERYKSNIVEDQACSVCYASLIFALHRSRSSKKVCIGQGFKNNDGADGNSMNSLGIGTCTRGFKNYVEGCPPKAVDIINFLHDNN